MCPTLELHNFYLVLIVNDIYSSISVFRFGTTIVGMGANISRSRDSKPCKWSRVGLGPLIFCMRVGVAISCELNRKVANDV